MGKSPLADLHEQALSDLEGLLGTPEFTWIGVDYPCVVSTLARGTTIDWGGALVDIKFSIIVRTEVTKGSAQPFTAGKTLEYEEIEYRIVQVRQPAPGAHWHLDLIDANR
jgi:hypothetical protein